MLEVRPHYREKFEKYIDASGISLPVGYEIITKTEDVYDKKKKKWVKKSKFTKNETMRDKLEILNFHFGLSIFRSIVINCVQLYINEHKPRDKKVIMAGIYCSCRNNPTFLG